MTLHSFGQPGIGTEQVASDDLYTRAEHALDRALASVLEAYRLLDLLKSTSNVPDDKGDDEPGGDIDWGDGGPLDAS